MEIELKAIIVLILLSYAIGFYSYPLLPEMSASHWNLAGEVDGHLPAFWAAFLLPLISTVLALLFFILPSIDPLQANIETFKKDYYRFCLAVLLFLFIIYVQSILWNLGTQVSFNLTLPILLGCLFFYLGTFLEKTKPNWFIGIRTPWTISSPEVWDKTHMLGAKLFKAAGVISILSVLFPAYAFWVIFAVVIAAAIATVVYSYVAYSRLGKKARKTNH